MRGSAHQIRAFGNANPAFMAPFWMRTACPTVGFQDSIDAPVDAVGAVLAFCCSDQEDVVADCGVLEAAMASSSGTGLACLLVCPRFNRVDSALFISLGASERTTMAC